MAEGDDGRRRSVWIRAIPETTGTGEGPLPDPEARWRYPDLDELLARPAERQPAFHRAIGTSNGVAAANAAIALARLGDASGAKRLFEAVETPSLPLPMRCAAVEALGNLPGDEPRRLLSKLLDQYAEPSARERRSVYLPELHAELIAALGLHVSPAGDERFQAALRSRSVAVRLEAVRRWTHDDASPLPEALIDLRAAGDPRLRIAVMEAVAARQHADAHRLLGEAVHDHALDVRLAAIRGLGALADAEAVALLEPLLSHHATRMREAAVAALAASEAYDILLKAAGDESWRVRMEVARALAGFDGHEASRAARTLLDDASPEVHRELLASVGRWPVEQAGPILLDAMAKDSFSCRKAAAHQLAAQWPQAASFPADGPPERRRVELQRLAKAFREQFPMVEEGPPEPETGNDGQAVSSEELERVEQLLAAEDMAGLSALGPRCIDVLEVLALDRQRRLPEDVYLKVLPDMHPAFALLARLTNDDVIERRRAAAELDALAEKGHLGPLAAERLCRLVTPEPDALVFQSVLSAVAADRSETAHRIAYAAVGHPAAEVRRRGCMHLAAHPDAKHAPALLPAIEDESDAVVVAALRALAASGHLADTGALDELLRSGNEPLQLEVALALVHLDDPRGVATLERLAYSHDAAVRRRVAETMGELADPIFTPNLIRLLDDRVSVMRAALAALPATAGEDQSLLPDGAPATTTERVRRWKAWFATQ